MNIKKANDLLNRFRQGKETKKEEELLKFWLHGVNAEKSSGLSKEELIQAQDNMWDAVKPQPAVKHYKLWPSAAAAAILLMTLSASLYFFIYNNAPATIEPVKHYTSTIVPGGNKAILTLADGKKIILNDAANGELAEQSGIKISKTADGQLIYTVADDFANAGKQVLYNTIETPNGGQYQVNLPDGSSVWLNAASRLRFPTHFSGAKRSVELLGEGYFEIAHNKKMPFKVKTSGQEIEVLGTHFNINSYPDELTRTTLLEGSVKLNLPGLVSGAVILKPGQQAVLAQDNFKVSQVDTEIAVAWKNGYFRFDDEELESIMHKVSRWYNVQVVFENERLKTEPFAGIITRTTKVGDLLKMLEQAGEVKFKIENNKIIVMNKD